MSQARVEGLQSLGVLQVRRAERLARVAKRLESGLGEGHPRVQTLKEMQTRAEKIQKIALDTAARLKRFPHVKPYEWAVFGHVCDAKGQPLAGLKVRLFDKGRKYDDLLGETMTNEFGDFVVVYHIRDFEEKGEKAPELYVQIKDAQGKELYSSKSAIRYQSGKIEYFDIQI